MASEETEKEGDEAILQELCTVNGLNYDKLPQGVGLKVKCLEIFFFGCPRIVGLSHFPSLSILRIINQRIFSMNGVGSCPSLKELWICEGDIEVIEDLTNCPQLVKVYFYSNKIKAITGISHLSKLETLWLNNNKINKIENIDTLTELLDLNLASNYISTLDNGSLSSFHRLRKLNLSGNPLTSLEELSQLYCLTSLQSLSLCDPLYSPSSICRLCNYSTLILYHMPWLKWLDSRDVDSTELRDLIKGLVNKKKQFYRLKIHNQRQTSWQENIKLDKKYAAHRVETGLRMRVLFEHIKSLEQHSNLNDDTCKAKKIGAIKERIEQLDSSLSTLKAEMDTERDRVRDKQDKTIGQWMLELQSAGNVRYIQGTDEFSWYRPCVELVMSRFIATCASGITHLNIKSVLRIENSLLHNQFMDTLRSLLEAKSLSPKTAFRDLLDYLFIVWSPGTDLVAMGNSGCGPITLDRPYVVLTNSVGIAESARFIDSGRGQNGGVLEGELLLCKVYIGNMAELVGKEMPVKQEDTHCLYRNISMSSVSVKSLPLREYYVYDSRLILPEYLVTVTYDRGREEGGRREGESEGREREEEEDRSSKKNDDSDLINSFPQPEGRPKLVMLDENMLLKVTESKSLEFVKTLDLSCNRLTRFRFSSLLPHLSCLSISCNEISTAEDFAHMPNLHVLDLSFNRLATLDGLKGLPRLHVLDVSWNSLSFPYQDILLLKRHAPSLLSLDLRHNLWKQNKNSQIYIIGTLRTLQTLNGETITDQEKASVLKQFVSSHVSLSSLLPHCQTDIDISPSLMLCTIAEQIISKSKLCPEQSTPEWANQITALDLTDMHVHQISCLDQLVNLKWACFRGNALTDIQGIESCHKLEELTLDDNYLQNCLSLHWFPHLRWLSLENNHLTSLPLSSSPLPQLTYVNISRNYIRDITGIETLTSLQEFYASHNYLENLRQLFSLKPLVHLVAIDLTCNPLASHSAHYRLFCIYHFPTIKAIDARAVTNTEIGLAKEKLGGRLSQDLVYEKCHSNDFNAIKKLDFVQCGLKHVDLSPVSSLDNLVSLNLEHNSLTSFSGLIHLSKLKVLCLNHNRVEYLIRPTGSGPSSTSSGGGGGGDPVMQNLQVLHLAYNGINSLVPLQLYRLPGLRALFLQGNEISRIEGLDGLHHLTELVLDRNKIKCMQENSLQHLVTLKEFHLEENRLSDLSHFESVKNLERLYLGMNRIQDYSELEKLGCLSYLIELSIISNPISRRMQHRSLLIYKLPSLQSLDGVMVTSDERQTAEATFSDRCQHQDEDQADTALLPSLTNAGQVKVMNVPLYMSTHTSRQSQAMEARALHLQTLQAFQDRRKGRR
ncbi:PREDICTED: leucine-rich repeat-containing protein 9-like [Amphimedon queenslandica]|uniref:Leucine-rich repeat-containing protein 9 n=1 Tax=Amphimedon queenslandica TaxID=400682 RepID=A0A1X7UY43_AMPQE|nr:PREDICTED: leucine-rich repeat-containing protein 9-like [Amphimedon queenslandica]|eukprot:XP_019851716.1 PREDICTED: leucine-rich repeat-containing protein 9-like [Amphimedon queenslandica]